MRDLKKAIPPGDHENHISEEKYRLHAILPSPDIKWTDYYYQSVSDCAAQIIRDKSFMWRLKFKKQKSTEE